ncbi:mandelate racemase/muconate lactonizing enzyme family protein [Microlunatus soli]|uniref:Enolase C-terminal domain-like n=1 Tax=Microlunatus soli TaxID=630515 RepID=A0A1H1ZQB2_9ACTN|nr:enolase C-terminal domain-like protein [Microlunatus soli]SDT35612.1 Enolase C-terminal domain-like [Microlunatus soli]
MNRQDPIVTSVEFDELPVRYPRTVGRNARLGSHGSGGAARIVLLGTDTGCRGWGMIEAEPAAPDTMIGKTLTELIDSETGVRDDDHLWADAALHDLLGVVEDRPVWDILGAAGDRTIGVYDGAIYFDDLDPDDAPRGPQVVLDNCTADAGLGFGDFKLKIGRGNRWLDRKAGDDRDIEITRAVREAWPDARILVDANDGYDLDGFCRYLDAVAEIDLYWVEEPFDDNADDLAALRRHLDRVSPDTLIAEGETHPDVESLLAVAADGHIDVLLMDVMSYGITRWRRIMPRLLEIGVAASPHAWGRPLKTLYAAQLAAGLGNVPVVEGVPGRTDRVDDSGYRFVDGALVVPERPGFGLPLPG